MQKIDEIDMKILSELVKDANISVPKLSKKINANPSVIYSRLKKLEGHHLIKRFTIEVNESMLGLGVSAIIGLSIDSKFRDEILEQILRYNLVREISEVTGRFDVLIGAKAHSLEELHEFVTTQLGQLNGVRRTEIFVQMSERKNESEYAVAPIR